ncbi:MAG TPA: zf-HC2 domain-containing protein [Pyrinomonadaceae bacterium]|nr:zf-HC2 domain-containing protein [Pyrinomonadaceae bacterium]
MRQETNNEIDLLLRRLSRRQEVPVSDGDSRIDSDHLDADELNAFAENALPAATRARYTEHLADCSKCREIVVQLSASVPVMTAKVTAPVAEPSAFGKFLASFFSPMVLRYAVPALGLIVVAAIGFVVFQSRQPDARVALLEPQAQSPASTPDTQPSPPTSFYNYDNAPKEPSSPASARPSNAKPVTEAQDPQPPSAPAPAGNVGPPKTDAPVQKAEPQAVANAAAAQPQSSATPAATVDEMRVDVQGRRNEQAGAAQPREMAKQKAASDFEQKKTEGVRSSRGRAAAPASGAGSLQRDGSSATFSVAEEAEKDRGDGIIRTVAGRRFRKQSGIWVDTAYSSSNAIRDIARDSEPYRALIADEPNIKKIADALEGPFVVVWKGRTYRIR